MEGKNAQVLPFSILENYDVVIPNEEKSQAGSSVHSDDEDIFEEEPKMSSTSISNALQNFGRRLSSIGTGRSNAQNNWNKATIKIKAVGSLSALDKDGDGTITKEELEQHIQEHAMNIQEKALLKKALLGVTFLLILFTLVGAGMTYMVIMITKDMKTSNDKMIDSSTGNVLQCANSDMLVSNGVMMARDPNLMLTLKMFGALPVPI